MSVLQRVKQWLLDTWKISVPDEWLSACWDWIQEEQQGHPESFEAQCSHVFDQWLLSDLREIGASSFPPNLGRCEKHNLGGVYSAQINHIVDISQPMYKQLQKLTGTENENASVDSTTQSTQRQQEDSRDKVTRMMMMILSDGNQEVKGIEREFVPTLSHKTPLGTKVIVHGGVVCRKGILLLTPENFSILGGEVEGLMQLTQKDIVEEKLRINSSKINPNSSERNPRSSNAPHELPRMEFKNPTLLSCTDLSLAMKKCQNNFALSKHEPHQWKSHSESENQKMNPFKCSSRVFQPTSAGNSRIKTETSRTDVVPRNPSGNDCFSDDSTDLIFEEAMIANGIEDPPPSSRPGDNPDALNFRTSSAAGENADDLLLDDDDDLAFENDGKNSTRDVRGVGVNNPSRLRAFGSESDEDLLAAEMDVDPFEAASNPCPDYRQNSKRLKLSSSESTTSTAFTTPTTTTSAATTNLGRPAVQRCERPFTYISHVLRENKTGIYFIKAYISTVLGRLERNEGRAWSMEVRLDDGSSTLVARFQDKLLRKIIGHSASECEDMRRRMKTEPHLGEVLKKAMKQCQEALIHMSVIFELHVVQSPSSLASTPVDGGLSYVIADYRRVTMDDFRALEKVVSQHNDARPR